MSYRVIIVLGDVKKTAERLSPEDAIALGDASVAEGASVEIVDGTGHKMSLGQFKDKITEH